MPLNSLDTSQRLAATAPGGEVAVSAGAGSGKTRLLVSRYLHLMKKEALPLSSIAAITFTNKAADNMKARITEKAYDLAEKYPKDAEMWIRVAENAHNAPISTIHSFCSSILRSNPVDAGIDPYFTVIDEVNNSGLKNEIINGFVSSQLTENPEEMGFLLDTFDMRGLKNNLRTLLDKRTHVVKFLDTIEDSGGTSPGVLERKYTESLSAQAAKYLFMLKEFHTFRPADDKLSDIHSGLESGFEKICAMFGGKSMDTRFVSSLIESINLKGGSPKKWGKERIKEVRAQLDECRTFLKSLVSFYEKEQDITAIAASLLMKNYVLIDRLFLDRKKSERYLDNDDILIETWKLLRTNGRICGNLSRMYRHILVDEFQDTDGIQMDILRMITGNSSASLFTVGDSKQSIFRFRGADVTVFDSFKINADSFLRLNTNYRSSPAILSFINTVFEKVIGNEPEHDFEAVYSNMNPNRSDKSDAPSVELNVFDIDGSDTRRMNEAEYIAKRAKEVSEEFSKEKNGESGGAKYSYGDMALLLRKGTNISYYEEAFLRAGIPFVNKIGGRLAGSPVAYDVGNLLAWLCSPEDPALITAVLISPFFNIDADTLFSIRSSAGSAKNMPFYLAGDSDFQSDEIAGAAEILGRLLDMSGRIPMRDILGRAFEETNYTLSLLADRIVGEQSLAVLDLILDTADTFEKNGGSAAEFAELLLSGEQFTSESARVETLDDALSIMTIHGSKGLEFKVVFLADITSRGRRDSNDIIFDDDFGPGFQIRDAHRGRLKTFVNRHSEEIERKKHIAESKRLFYVACTRAEDRLVISGGAPPKDIDGKYGKDNWMSWLHAALKISSDGEFLEGEAGLFAYERFCENTSSGARSVTAYWQELMDSAGNGSVNDYPVETLTAPIKRVPVSGLPSHMSPNQIVDYMLCPAKYLYKHVHGLNLRDSVFSSDAGGGQGAAYGSYAHRVMEKLDYNNMSGWEELANDLADSSMPGSLKKNLADSLWKFSESDLFAEIAQSEDVYREEPFTFIEHSVLVRGVIDLYFKHGDDIMIVDFKTSKPPAAGNDIPEEYRLQLELYALAIGRALHTVPSKLILYYLGAHYPVELPCTRDTLDAVSGALGDALVRMSDGDYRPARSARCDMCTYAALCGME
jgi:ATP-dependent helicase/nuclease subunit A